MVQPNKAISIRMPPPLFELIKAKAEKQRRSFSKQTVFILEGVIN